MDTITESFLLLIENRIEFLAKKYFNAAKDYFDHGADDPKSVENFVITVNQHADPTGGKYLDWILTQILVRNTILWPEDANNVRNALEKFHSLKNKRDWQGSKDINNYKRYGDLSSTVRANSTVRSNREKVNAAARDGLELVIDKPPYKLYKVTTNEAGLAIGWRDTEWCVQDPKYFDQYGPPFHCLTETKVRQFRTPGSIPDETGTTEVPIQLWHQESAMLMDTEDRPTSFDIMNSIGFREPMQTITSSPNAAYDYVENVLEGPWLEGSKAEQAILQDIPTAFNYLINYRYENTGKGMMDFKMKRWPEFEEKLLNNLDKSPYLLTRDALKMVGYATTVIGGRWPEAEPKIAAVPKTAMMYALDVIKGPWPEGEEAISKSAEASYDYANSVLDAPFPKGEEAILKNQTLLRAYHAKLGAWEKLKLIQD